MPTLWSVEFNPGAYDVSGFSWYDDYFTRRPSILRRVTARLSSIIAFLF
ncbi:MAG: hypothetical protein NVSMB18_22100 [Acetobacteraceae bacterium]